MTEQQTLSQDQPARTVFTIGHSTRSMREFLNALKAHGIERLIDIRHFPVSRFNPQFNQAPLKAALEAAGIDYIWLPELGGYRKGGYLEHMKTEEFQRGLEKLQAYALQKRTAYMCAEVKWFKCHRRHVSDRLEEQAWQVIHIIDEKRVQRHRRKTNRIRCDYPGQQEKLFAEPDAADQDPGITDRRTPPQDES